MKKILITLILVALIAFGATALIACEKPDEGLTPTDPGTETVTYTYSITNPTHTAFAFGEDLDLTGFQVTRTGSDGSVTVLSEGQDFTIDTSSYNKDAAGTYTLTVSVMVNGVSVYSGNITVSVAGIPSLTGGTAVSVSKVYDGTDAKLSVSLPDTTDVTLSYRIKTAEDSPFGEWTDEEPALNSVGRLYVAVKFSKPGYTPLVIGEDGTLTIEVTPATFGNAQQMSISGQSKVWDGNATTAPYSFSVPDGASLLFSEDGTTYGPTQPAYSAAGVYTVYYKITKDNYITVQNSYTVTISKAEIEGITHNALAYLFVTDAQNTEGAYLSMVKGVVSGDVVSYSLDGGLTYVSQRPGSTANGSEFSVKVERGENHEYTFTQTLYVIKVYQAINLHPADSIEYKDGDDSRVYIRLDTDDNQSAVILVRISSDGGATYGEWSDYKAAKLYFDKIEAGTYKHEFLIANASGSQCYYCDLVLPYKEVKGLSVKTAPDRVNYALGGTLDLTGLVLTVTYDDDSTEDFDYDELPAAMTLSLNHGAGLNTRFADGYNLTFTYGTKTASVTIHVYYLEQDLEFETASELIVQTAPTKTDYAPGESVDLTGLIIEASFPSIFGSGVFVILPISRYTTDADSVDMNTPGPLYITVTGLELNGEESSLTANIRVFVDYPFKGTTWYDTEGLGNYLRVTIIDNENAFYYLNTSEDAPAEKLAATYSAVYSQDLTGYFIQIYYSYDKSEYFENFFYSDTEETILTEYETALSKLLDTDVVLAVKLYASAEFVIFFDLVVPNGIIAEETRLMFAGFGDFYFTDGIDTDQLVPTEYVFTAPTQIYCIYDQQDYSDAPFIGYWEWDDELLYISGTSFGNATERFYYEATEKSDGTWTISAMGGMLTVVYDNATDTIILSIGGYTRIDQAFAIVTLDTDDEYLSSYRGYYKVAKDSAFLAFTYQYGSIIKFNFENYSGEPITENITLILESVEYINVGEDSRYGTFGKYFTFDFETMTIALMEGLTEIETFDFVITYISEGSIGITFGDENFAGYIAEDFVIADGEHEGTFQKNSDSFYAGLPFVNMHFQNADTGNYIDFLPDGSYHLFIDEGYGFMIWGDYVVTAIDGNVYSLSYRDSRAGGFGEYYTGDYNGNTRILSSGDLTFDAPTI